jgi:hypothetical protein
MSLSILLSNIVNIGHLVRKYNPNNGLNVWNDIKKIIGDNTYNLSWKHKKYITDILNVDNNELTNITDVYNYMHDTLNIKGDDTDKDYDDTDLYKHNEWSRNHFVLQLVRIIKNNDCSLLRVCQIAYNIGQIYASHNFKSYDNKIIYFLMMNNMLCMSEFIDQINQNDDEKITDLCSEIKNYYEQLNKLNNTII